MNNGLGGFSAVALFCSLTHFTRSGSPTDLLVRNLEYKRTFVLNYGSLGFDHVDLWEDGRNTLFSMYHYISMKIITHYWPAVVSISTTL